MLFKVRWPTNAFYVLFSAGRTTCPRENSAGRTTCPREKLVYMLCLMLCCVQFGCLRLCLR